MTKNNKKTLTLKDVLKENNELKNEVRVLAGKVKNNASNFITAKGSIVDIKSKLSKMESLLSGKLIKIAAKDSSAIHDMYSIIFLKLSVIEMVGVSLKNNKDFCDIDVDSSEIIFKAVNASLSKSRDWWLKRDNLTIGAWIKVFDDLDDILK